jgi:hypothetical protein
MLQRFNFAFFQKALLGPNRESPDGRGEGNDWLFRLPFCGLAFLLGADSAKNIPLEPPRKR